MLFNLDTPVRTFFKALISIVVVLSLSACSSSKDDVGVLQTVQSTAADGTSVQAYVAQIPDSQPDKLIVFCHGHHQTVEGAWLNSLLAFVRPDIAVVSTDYRDNMGFPTLMGAEDTIAITEKTKAMLPSIKTVYLLGVSMGGAISGTAVTESIARSPTGKSLFDYWFDVEGVTNLSETWLEATAADPKTATEIERDAGGKPVDVPQEYKRRSPALNTQAMKAGGLKGVVIVHAPFDGLVPYNQAREMAAALLAAGIPVELFTVGRHKAGVDSGTTLGSDFSGITGAPNVVEAAGINLAGHGWEGDPDQPVIRTGFERLHALIDGSYSIPQYNESFVAD